MMATNVSNYQSPYPKVSDLMTPTQAKSINSPTGISSATLNKLNDQITSVNNDLAALANKTRNDGANGDKAAFSSDTAQVAADYAQLATLTSQVSSATQGLSSDDAKAEASFLGDAAFTTQLANGALSWGPSSAAVASAMSTGSGIVSSLSSAANTLSHVTSSISTGTGSGSGSTYNPFPQTPVTYNWNAMADAYNKMNNK